MVVIYLLAMWNT